MQSYLSRIYGQLEPRSKARSEDVRPIGVQDQRTVPASRNCERRQPQSCSGKFAFSILDRLVMARFWVRVDSRCKEQGLINLSFLHVRSGTQLEA